MGDRDTKRETEYQLDRCKVDERIHKSERSVDDKDSAEQEDVCEGLYHSHAYREEHHHIQDLSHAGAGSTAVLYREVHVQYLPP